MSIDSIPTKKARGCNPHQNCEGEWSKSILAKIVMQNDTYRWWQWQWRRWNDDDNERPHNIVLMMMKIGRSNVWWRQQKVLKMMVSKTRKRIWRWWGSVSKTKDVDYGNFGSKDYDNGNWGSKGDDEDGWCFQLEGTQTIMDTPTVDSDEARIMGLKALNLRSWTRHKSMNIEMKETRWNKTRILDLCVNDWRWIPWKGPR